MSNFQCQIQRFPLLPYSQLVWEMTRWIPSVYMFPMRFRWIEGVNEKEHIEQAIRRTIQNHPVFAMCVDGKGRHYAGSGNDLLHSRYLKIDMAERGEDLIITTRFSRILGDGRSGQIFLEDVKRAYEGLPLDPDDYWRYVAQYEQSKTSPHYKVSHDWLINEFTDESVPVRPTVDRRWLPTILPPKAGIYIDDYSLEQTEINSLVNNHHLTLDGVFSLCAALSIAEYCGTDAAALTWAYEGREKPEEQRIFGSLHRDIPFIINHKSQITNHKSDLIRFTRNQIRQGIAHSDYPYTLTYPYNKRWNYAVNVLHTTDMEDFLPTLDLPMKLEPMPEQKYAYALLDIEILERAESLQLRYRYSATHYKPESIRRFADLVRKYVEWLID